MAVRGKGDPSDPTWSLILAALERAAAQARKRNYAWEGPSCYLVSKLALALVIATRDGASQWEVDGGPPLAGNPKGHEFAYADHYLHMRGEAARVGHGGYPFLMAKIHGYEQIKTVAYGLKDLPSEPPSASAAYNYGLLMPPGVNDIAAFVSAPFRTLGSKIEYGMRTNKANPMSRPDPISVEWAEQGLADGLDDWRANPHLPGWVDDDTAVLSPPSEGGVQP